MPSPEPRTASPAALARLRSGLRAEAVAVVGATTTANAGRWRLNAGSPMLQILPRLHDGPVVAILDLETATLAERLPANYMHYEWSPIGRWSEGQIIASGPERGVYASLHLYQSEDSDPESIRYRLADADYVAALLRRDHPWQASIETDGQAEIYERVTGPTEVNGEAHDPATWAYPMYVVRHARIDAAAVVDVGADPQAERIAAARIAHPFPPNSQKESLMSAKDRLTALTAAHPAQHHGLIARMICEEADDAAIEAAITAAEIAALKAAAAEKDAEIAALKAQLAEATKADDDEDEAQALAARRKAGLSAGGTQPTPNAGGDATDGPTTWPAAYAILAAEKITGIRARSAAMKRWPHLRPAHLQG